MAEHNGDESYLRLIRIILGDKTKYDQKVFYSEYDNIVYYGNMIKNSPLSFNRPGRYPHQLGNITALRNKISADGNFWQKGVYDLENARYFYSNHLGTAPQANYYKGDGFSVRCIAK